MKQTIATLMILATAVAVPLVAQASRSQSISLTFTMHFTKRRLRPETGRRARPGHPRSKARDRLRRHLRALVNWRHQADRAPPGQRSRARRSFTDSRKDPQLLQTLEGRNRTPTTRPSTSALLNGSCGSAPELRTNSPLGPLPVAALLSTRAAGPARPPQRAAASEAR
jgi:hypothetical protein